MHKQYIKMLVCPSCHKELEWHIQEENEERIINGKACCLGCNSEYEVKDEIAVFLTSELSRNDLWDQGESALEKFFKENKEIYNKLMNTPEEELNGADYWYKATYFEMKRDFATSSRMFKSAFKKIYTEDYINGWDSQMDFVIKNLQGEEPIIDIATGKGYLVEKILTETKNYVVVTDFSPTILMRNKEYYKAKGLYQRLSLIAFDARKTPFRDNSIVNLTSNMGLQNIDQPGDVVKELCRITKDKFMAVMFFIDKEDKKHMDLFKEWGNTAYATKENAIETFKNAGWQIEICNSFLANIKATPESEIIEGAGIDGFPIEDTEVEFCVIKARKQESLESSICKKISSFEEIINFEASKLREILAKVSKIDIVKASMGASPQVNQLLRDAFEDIDFNKERTEIGSVRIAEVENIHDKIVALINSRL